VITTKDETIGIAASRNPAIDTGTPERAIDEFLS
jgi:hypothetical protein